MASEIEIAWAAGLFEGEGSIGLDRQRSAGSSAGNRRCSLAVAVKMTDEDVVRRFHAIVGVGTVNGPHESRPGCRPEWRWRASGAAAESLMEVLAPYFGLRRSAKLAEVLAQIPEKFGVGYRSVDTQVAAPTHCLHCGDLLPSGPQPVKIRQYCPGTQCAQRAYRRRQRSAVKSAF